MLCGGNIYSIIFQGISHYQLLYWMIHSRDEIELQARLGAIE